MTLGHQGYKPDEDAMTARDEAIDAALAAEYPGMNVKGIADVHIERIIDAIPNDVLVRLAIERGALLETSRKIGIGREYRNGRYINHFAPLYRVVES